MTDTIDTLRQATDTALINAKAALQSGWDRLSRTDIDAVPIAAGNGSPHAEEIAAEMGALTVPLGAINRIRTRRRPTDRDPADQLLADIDDYNHEATDREEQAQAARDHRDELIRQALTHDTVSAARISDVTGLHIQRIYQIRRGERA